MLFRRLLACLGVALLCSVLLLFVLYAGPDSQLPVSSPPQTVHRPKAMDSVARLPESHSVSGSGDQAGDAGRPEVYWSNGRTSPFIASIVDIDALIAGLKGRAYKNEIILFNGDSSPNMLEMVVNFALKFKALGFEHWVMVTDSRESCETAQGTYGPLACVFGETFWASDFIYNTPNAFHNDRIARLWIYRWIVFTKAIQVGLNVLVTDLDVYWADSLYKYVKHKNLQFNLFAPHEMSNPGINCGLVYAQNVWKDGPVAWISAQVTDRTLRWREYPGFKNPQMPRYELRLFEQDIFNDATCSAIIGRPVNPRMQRYKNTDRWFPLHTRFCDSKALKAEKLTFPEEYVAVDYVAAGGQKQRQADIEYFQMRLPNTEGIWLDQFGRPAFPGPRRNASLGFLKLMHAGGVPVWTEPDALHDPENKRATRVETFVRSPRWLFGIYPEGGIKGSWGTSPPRIVAGHLIELGGHHQQSKRFVMKMLKWWDYEASKIVKGNKIWAGATDTERWPKLITFWPNTPVWHQTRKGSKAITRGNLFLAHIASQRQRLPVWPQTDCSSPWVHKDPSAVHGVLESKVYAHGTSTTTAMCYDMGYMNAYCATIGLLWPDFLEYNRTMPESERFAVNKENTLFPGAKMDTISGEHQLVVSYDQLVSELRRTANARVVFVAQHLSVFDVPTDIDQQLHEVTKPCEYFELDPVWPQT